MRNVMPSRVTTSVRRARSGPTAWGQAARTRASVRAGTAPNSRRARLASAGRSSAMALLYGRGTTPSKPVYSPPPMNCPRCRAEVKGEVKAVRGLQVEILSMLKAMASVHSAVPVPPPAQADDPDAPLAPPAVRSRRRKTVLVIDDDEQTRTAAVAALEQAEVPVR